MEYMQKRLSVSICTVSSLADSRRATMMLASSALLIVCLSDCDLISILMVRSSGNTTAPPKVGLPDIFEPSVYINLVLSQIGR